MTGYDFDLFVIGAGSGGVRAARVAAAHGAKVIIAEEFRIGGTCVIRGCVPKKLMVYASRYKDHFEDAAGFGWRVEERSFDWPSLVAAKEKEISRLSAIYRTNLEKAGVAIEECRAVIEDPHTVRLTGGRRVSARFILLATGSRPVLDPDVPGREFAITSNEVFDLPTLPERMLIICGVLPTQIEKNAAGCRVHLTKGTTLEADQVMIATGRWPNTAGLGLERAGVALDALGAVKVDKFSKTNLESVYAVGDVTNRVQLTPVAIREGHAFADTVFGNRPHAVDYQNIPSAVFSTPELGCVGLTEGEARAAFDCVDLYEANFRPLKATLSGRAEKTLMKIVVDGTTDRVLGVHILGEDAAEMAQLLAIGVKMGAKKADFDAAVALHPTSAEELVTLRTRTARFEREVAGPEGPECGPVVEAD